MKAHGPVKELSPQLASRLGPRDDGTVPSAARAVAPVGIAGVEPRGGSDYSKLRGIIRSQREQIQSLENEVAHFQTRLHRIEDGHKLELSRLKKEVEYHKRLRQGADQRSFELEDKLARVNQQSAAARQLSHDEEKDSLIVQSQLLVSKNSELTYKLKTVEGQVSQLEELKAALERELDQAYGERDELAQELERILTRQHHAHHQRSHSGLDGEGDGDGDLYGLGLGLAGLGLDPGAGEYEGAGPGGEPGEGGDLGGPPAGPEGGSAHEDGPAPEAS
ncbi:hypothetical protein HYH03_012116 [Edaphochlamys debaryana]|uniref:Uncharacterized protein n=1 Tax=Edaphochlamys debaryana TaxID=47281 RepID=A0A835XTM6_9CHLO|nr:hypothetical protein HYH03_012116 [Edaphochlamys debaryana]|eukprot:KAG2489480.1 hypothetical protein HYH03_012116 [Edaphochlamys debaryana]